VPGTADPLPRAIGGVPFDSLDYGEMADAVDNHEDRLDNAEAAIAAIQGAIQVLDASSSANLALTTSSTDIAGATIPITTVTASCPCTVTATFDMVTITAGTAVGQGQLFVDGVEVTSARRAVHAATTLNARETDSQSWKFTLATVGLHTIKLRGLLSAGTGAVTINITHTGLVLTAFDL
jgi:hypothetical protein